jgi:hypothetical protein
MIASSSREEARMSRLLNNTRRAMSDYFAGFEERAGRTHEPDTPDQARGGAACGLCFAALVAALGYVGTAASAAGASPF